LKGHTTDTACDLHQLFNGKAASKQIPDFSNTQLLKHNPKIIVAVVFFRETSETTFKPLLWHLLLLYKASKNVLVKITTK